MSPGSTGPLPIAILISGRGSNMVAIAEAAREGRLPVTVSAVVSDQSQAAGLQRARELGLTREIVSHRPGQAREDYDRELALTLRRHRVQLVILAGFMRILGPGFVRDYAGRLLNIHPSLLPSYRGLHTHQRVLADGRHEHGCTVHFVTDELDGGPPILQAKVAVLPGDSVQILSARVQAQEHRIYPTVIEWYAAGRLQWRDNQAWLDGKPLLTPVVLDAREAGAR